MIQTMPEADPPVAADDLEAGVDCAGPDDAELDCAGFDPELPEHPAVHASASTLANTCRPLIFIQASSMSESRCHADRYPTHA
jgi:hypothetical protein